MLMESKLKHERALIQRGYGFSYDSIRWNNQSN